MRLISIGGISCILGMMTSVLAGTTSLAVTHYDKQQYYSNIANETTDISLPRMKDNGNKYAYSIELYRVLSENNSLTNKVDQYSVIYNFLNDNDKILRTLLGEDYDNTIDSFNGQYSKYGKLVNGFLSGSEYRRLLDEIDSRISMIDMVEKDSEQYQNLIAEIDELWGKISILAGQINSQIAVLEGAVMTAIDDIIYVINDKLNIAEDINAAIKNGGAAMAVSVLNTITAEEKSMIIELNLLRLELGLVDESYRNVIIGAANI